MLDRLHRDGDRGISRQHDHRGAGRPFPNLIEEVYARDVGQIDVQQDHVGRRGGQLSQQRGAVLRLQHLVAAKPQVAGYGESQVLVVVNQQDPGQWLRQGAKSVGDSGRVLVTRREVYSLGLRRRQRWFGSDLDPRPASLPSRSLAWRVGGESRRDQRMYTE